MRLKKFIPAMTKFRKEGYKMPWGWHLAYYDPRQDGFYIAPIPINFIIKFSRWLYAHIKPSWLDRLVKDAYEKGKIDGQKTLSNVLRLKSIELEMCVKNLMRVQRLTRKKK